MSQAVVNTETQTNDRRNQARNILHLVPTKPLQIEALPLILCSLPANSFQVDCSKSAPCSRTSPAIFQTARRFCSGNVSSAKTSLEITFSNVVKNDSHSLVSNVSA